MADNQSAKKKDPAVTRRTPSGVVISVLNARISRPSQQLVFVEIRNQTNMDEQSRSHIKGLDIQKTNLVPRNNAVWNHNFFYNSEEMVDDNITFVLRGEDQGQIGRETIRRFAHRDQYQQVQSEKVKETVALKEAGREVAWLEIEFSFYLKEDIIGGIEVPLLSLRPPQDFKPQYSAVDLYNTNFNDKARNVATRANCFNFLDGCATGKNTVPGFEDIDFMPTKFKGISSPKNQIKVEPTP